YWWKYVCLTDDAWISSNRREPGCQSCPLALFIKILSMPECNMRIIFHIGMGKTGTSSIQRSLRKADDRLIKVGVKYLGLMLEHSPIKLYGWQNGAATAKFSTLDPIEAGKQVEEILTKTARHFEQAGVHTLIWSNEWFFGRH